MIIIDIAVHIPDDIEKTLEDDEENDCSKNVSSGVQETGSSNLVDPSPNLDNVLQVFQKPQAIEFLRGLMTHQAAQVVQSVHSNYTVSSQGVISLRDENPSNPDQNDSTVSQADDLSAKTEYLENLTLEYE